MNPRTGRRLTRPGLAIVGVLVFGACAATAAVDTFWFAWTAFRPDTTVVTTT